MIKFSKDNEQYMKAHMKKYPNIYKDEIDLKKEDIGVSILDLFAAYDADLRQKEAEARILLRY